MRRLFFVLPLFLLPAAAFAQDADGDGALDATDVLPCDAAASALAFAPAEDEHGLLLFEDRWPSRGDLDFNDVALAHHVTLRLNAAGLVSSMRLRFEALAIGGTVHNGLGLHLPVPRDAATSMTRTVRGVTRPLVQGQWDPELTVRISDDLRELFDAGDDVINSRSDLPRLTGHPIEVDFTFDPPVALNIAAAPFDTYIFRTDDPTHEIHLPQYPGTAAMAPGFFGSYEDGSQQGRWYVDDHGLPFALSFPEIVTYPGEEQDISDVYPGIVTFATSGGTQARDFYRNLARADLAYSDASGAGVLRPAVVAAPIDHSCNPDNDGDGVPDSLDCAPADPSIHTSSAELCNGLDDDCDGSIDENLGVHAPYVRDVDGDGFGGNSAPVYACAPPPGYAALLAPCSNGSRTDCNVAGTTLVGSSAFVDQEPPSGWIQCAGFINTAGNDVAPTFFDNCLNATGLRIRVFTEDGAIEEDISATGMSSWTAWPNWNYLGGNVTLHTRTRWGSTTFFTTTTGRDACNSVSAPSGNTFGSGNGGVGIVAPGNSGADEYRVSCGGVALPGRRIAMYRATNVSPTMLDCNDADASINPAATEICNGVDDNCSGVADENNPGAGAACASGQLGLCSAGLTSCSAGALICIAERAPAPEACMTSVDEDCDGVVDEPACIAPCSNGSGSDCNTPGTTLIASSAWVDTAPPVGWTQCAGFVNTSANDVAHNFFDNCLGSSRLRIRIFTTAGVLEEDVSVVNQNIFQSWPNWNYLGGTVTLHTRTRWGSTNFFTTTTGRDACNSVSAPAGNTFGTGNGGVAIVAGGNSGADELRVSCGGVSLPDRRIAIYR